MFRNVIRVCGLVHNLYNKTNKFVIHSNHFVVRGLSPPPTVLLRSNVCHGFVIHEVSKSHTTHHSR